MKGRSYTWNIIFPSGNVLKIWIFICRHDLAISLQANPTEAQSWKSHIVNLSMKFAVLHDFNEVKNSQLLWNSKSLPERQNLADLTMFKFWFCFDLMQRTLIFNSWYVIGAKLYTPFAFVLWGDLGSVIWEGLHMIDYLRIEQMVTFHSCRAGKFVGFCYWELLKSKYGNSILRYIKYKLY